MIIETKIMYCDGCKTEIEEEQKFCTTKHSHGTINIFIENDTLHFCNTCTKIALKRYIKLRKRPLVVDCETCHGTRYVRVHDEENSTASCAEVKNAYKKVLCNKCEF